MAALHTKRYEVAIWYASMTPQSLPDTIRVLWSLTPISAVIVALTACEWSSAAAVLVSAPNYNTADWLFNVRLEQGHLLWMP